MNFSTIRPWLAGATIAVSVASAASAQNAVAVFGARYAQLHAATAAKDGAALAQVLSPDYMMTDIQGQTRDYAQVQARLATAPGGPERQPKITVRSAVITGTAAVVKQQMDLHMTRTGGDGVPVTMDITTQSDDTWIQRGGVWLLQTSEQKEMTVSKAGEVVLHEIK